MVGVAFYPLGWGNKEVQDACADQSGPYELGKPVKIGSFYVQVIVALKVVIV